ncbi:MAG: 2,3-bisphosphoglycerate-independent phosphoglycerate mutase [Clostridia bacterium]
MKGNKQFMLIILDGVALNDEERGNAFKAAKKPNIDRLINTYPNTYVKASGLAVGLPEGQMGNSEVGHTNIGAGRIIYQELTRITKSIEDKDFFEKEEFMKAIDNCKKNNKPLHLMGLLSDGGVHSHNKHLYALLELAKKNDVKEVYVHAILDGRDTAPSSGIEYLKQLEDKITEIGIGKISTLIGRYYAMDRDNRWDRVKLAYDLFTKDSGVKFKTVQKAIENSYEAQEFDEFVKPISIVVSEDEPLKGKIKKGDSVIFFNFRPDRAREIVRTLTEPDFNEFERKNKSLDLCFVTMTRYDEKLKNVLVAYKAEKIVNTVGEYLSNNGYTQLRIAETEKYAHVTFFLNGGKEDEYVGEERILVKSPNVATYDLQPEMSAVEVTEKVIEAIASEKFDSIFLNFANGDMVGHTGNFAKAVEAVECVDKCLGKIISEIEARHGCAIVTADHGNCECMIDVKTGEVITSHSTFDVPCIVVADNIRSIETGKLCDLAPTLLDLMDLEIPKEMSGHSLVQKIK